MQITGKFLEVTEVRDISFVRDGSQKELTSVSFLIQWNICNENGSLRSQELVAEVLYEKDKCPNYIVGRIEDENNYDMIVYFHANRSSKDNRVFNSIRLIKWTAHVDNYGIVQG